MRNKKKNRIFLLLILLLGISIGFAALATTLKINGNAGIGKNSWNIYWDSIGNQDGVTPETDTEIVDEDTTHKKNIVTFDVKFDKPGDFYEFQVDAVNAGTIDAEILEIESKYNDTVIPSSGTSPLPSYLKYSVKYADGTDITVGDKLAKRTSTTEFTRKRYKIRVEYDKDAVTIADVNNQVGDVSHSFSFKVKYGQSTAPAAGAAVSFANDSWETIAQEGKEAAKQTSINNFKCGTYNVGDTKTIEMDLDGDNTPETYTVRIANCSTPAICSTEGFSQTACGFVVEFAEVITTHRMNAEVSAETIGSGNNGGWEYTDMRAYLNNGVYAYENIDYSANGLLSKLPADLRNNLADTTVVSGHGTSDASNSITTDKLYLLSPHEVWEDANISEYGIDYYDKAYDNTRQLDYYKEHGVTNASGEYDLVIKYKVPENQQWPWWLRSSNGSNLSFFSAYADGDWYLYFNATGIFGVSPAFKLK